MSYEIYKHKIEFSPNILYKVSVWKNRDNHIWGYIVLDSNDKLDLKSINPMQLDYIKNVPNKNKIGFIHLTDIDTPSKYLMFCPYDKIILKKNNISLEIEKYEKNSFLSRSSGYYLYDFSNYKETKDSIFFYNLSNLNDSTSERLSVIKFLKSNIYISIDEGNNVKKMLINELIISNRNNEIISNKTFCLFPRESIKSDKFSDMGLFKQYYINK